jgi:hypothetical protein
MPPYLTETCVQDLRAGTWAVPAADSCRHPRARRRGKAGQRGALQAASKRRLPGRAQLPRPPACGLHPLSRIGLPRQKTSPEAPPSPRASYVRDSPTNQKGSRRGKRRPRRQTTTESSRRRADSAVAGPISSVGGECSGGRKRRKRRPN